MDRFGQVVLFVVVVLILALLVRTTTLNARMDELEACLRDTVSREHLRTHIMTHMKEAMQQ